MSSSVLTIEELADYLKLSPEVILTQANQGVLPGRQIAHTWRFLKDAIDDWLRVQDSRAILIHQAGALVDDESLESLRMTIYADRGRAEVDE
jgi:excisionase family DNA binding protein